MYILTDLNVLNLQTTESILTQMLRNESHNYQVTCLVQMNVFVMQTIHSNYNFQCANS